MKTGIIYHHLGLGDTIICNGIINNYCKKFETLFIFCKPKFYTSVKFLYRNNPKVNIIPANDSEASIIYNYIHTDYKLLLGFNYLEQVISQYKLNFDEGFYKIAGLNFEKRYSDFILNRDKQREDELYNKLNKLSGNYIFLHDDPSRNLIINRDFIIDKTLPIIKPDINITDNIFDYCKIIENATEVHVMDSSFKNLCESLTFKTEKIYYHTKYLRPNMTKSKHNWNII